MNKTKENIEAGMYFSFKKTFRSYTDDVYNSRHKSKTQAL